jgi:hypothetical protein
MGHRVRVPAGYRRVDEPEAMIVVRDDAVDAVVTAYRAAPREQRTLHAFAANAANARSFEGRETAYAITLPVTELPVVVRHNRHGGALRAITGDLFLGATRAPLELEMSLALRRYGIATPAVVAYAVYPAGAGFARSDVVTEEITGGADLGSVLLATTPDSRARRDAWDATVTLVDRLTAAGARHHDLNVKNVLIGRDTGTDAFLLDVDRVQFGLSPRGASEGNYARLARSVEKWRRVRGARISDAELERLRRIATNIP